MKKIITTLIIIIFSIFICNTSHAEWFQSAETNHFERPIIGDCKEKDHENCSIYLFTDIGDNGVAQKKEIHIQERKQNAKGKIYSDPIANLNDRATYCIVHSSDIGSKLSARKFSYYTSITDNSVWTESYIKGWPEGANDKINGAAKLAYILATTPQLIKDDGSYNVKQNGLSVQGYAIWLSIHEYAASMVNAGIFKISFVPSEKTLEDLDDKDKGSEFIKQHRTEIVNLTNKAEEYSKFMKSRVPLKQISQSEYTEEIINNRKICGPFKIAYSAEEGFGGLNKEECKVNGESYNTKKWYFCDKEGNSMKEGPASKEEFYISINKNTDFDKLEIETNYLSCHANFYTVCSNEGNQEHIYLIDASTDICPENITITPPKASLEIIKIDKKTKEPLKGINFIIQRVDNEQYVSQSSDKTEYVKNKSKATVFSTNKNGIAIVSNLYLGEYKIIEQGNNKLGEEDVVVHENGKTYACIEKNVKVIHAKSDYKVVWDIVKDTDSGKTAKGYYKKLFNELIMEDVNVALEFFNHNGSLYYNSSIYDYFPIDFLEVTKMTVTDNFLKKIEEIISYIDAIRDQLNEIQNNIDQVQPEIDKLKEALETASKEQKKEIQQQINELTQYVDSFEKEKKPLIQEFKKKKNEYLNITEEYYDIYFKEKNKKYTKAISESIFYQIYMDIKEQNPCLEKFLKDSKNNEEKLFDFYRTIGDDYNVDFDDMIKKEYMKNYYLGTAKGRKCQILQNEEAGNVGLKIIKKGEQTPGSGIYNKLLEGVGFVVKTEDRSKYITADGEQTDQRTVLYTDSNGEIEIKDLLPGTYRYAEVEIRNNGRYQSNYGYKVNTKSDTVKILSGEKTKTVTVKNPLTTGRLIVKKLNSQNGSPISGMRFKIQKVGESGFLKRSGNTIVNYNASDNDCTIFVTGSDGTFTVENLEPGNYRIVELPDANWTSSGDTVATVKEGVFNPSPTIIYNTPVVKTRYRKVDADTGEGIAGVQFTLYKNGAVFATYTTDSGGWFSIGGLYEGSYVLKETYAPYPYEVDPGNSRSETFIDYRRLEAERKQKEEKENKEDGNEEDKEEKEPEPLPPPQIFEFPKVTFPNTRKYVNLSGYVWEDIRGTKDDKNNTSHENKFVPNDGANSLDQRLKGITVRLMYKGREDAVTTTDVNGNYSFTGIRIDELDKYYVEFEYNGMCYQNVEVNTGIANGSKAEESDRQGFNNKFATITNNLATSKSGDARLDLGYDTTETTSTLLYGTRTNYNMGWDGNDKNKPVSGVKGQYIIKANATSGFSETGSIINFNEEGKKTIWNKRSRYNY